MAAISPDKEDDDDSTGGSDDIGRLLENLVVFRQSSCSLESDSVLDKLLDLTRASLEQLARYRAGLFDLHTILDDAQEFEQIVETLRDCTNHFFVRRMIMDDESAKDLRDKNFVKVLEIMRNLSRPISNKHKLCQCSDLVDILLSVAKSSLPTNGFKESERYLALGTLNNISSIRICAVELFERQGFVSSILNLINEGKVSPLLQEWCMAIVSNLAMEPTIAASLVETFPAVFQVIVHAWNDPSSVRTCREWAMQTIYGLSMDHSHSFALYSAPGIMNVVRTGIIMDDDDGSNFTRSNAIGVIAEITHGDSLIAERMMDEYQDIIDYLADSMRNRTGEALETGAHTALIQIAQASPSSARCLFDKSHGQLVHDLIHLVKFSDTLPIQVAAKLVLNALHCPSARFHMIDLMTTLCSVRLLPRIGGGSVLQRLPLELMRNIALTLLW